MADEELNQGRRPMSLRMSEFTDEEEDNKESDVDLESNSEAGNKKLSAKY